MQQVQGPLAGPRVRGLFVRFAKTSERGRDARPLPAPASRQNEVHAFGRCFLVGFDLERDLADFVQRLTVQKDRLASSRKAGTATW